MVVPNAGPEVAPLQRMKDAVDRYPIAALMVLAIFAYPRQYLRVDTGEM
jgi:hypothetical protein